MTSVTGTAMGTATGTATGTTTSAAAAGEAALPRLSGDFDMFLKLLTTQMQNQDPLDPMDTSEYTQQLVQYSQVEQTIQQTATLKEILASLSTQSMAEASGFIGREAEIDSADAGLTAAAPAAWRYRAPRAVASLVATIQDSGGRTVDTRILDGSALEGRLAWDGRLANGTRAADGRYTLKVEGVDRDGDAVPVAVTSLGTVAEVVASSGQVTLGINGIELPAARLVRVAQRVSPQVPPGG